MNRKLFMLFILVLFVVVPCTLAYNTSKATDNGRWVSDWTQVFAGSCVTMPHGLGSVPITAQAMQAYYVKSTSAGYPPFTSVFVPGPSIMLDQITSTQLRICNYGTGPAIIQVTLE